jgi:hypothetical protein
MVRAVFSERLRPSPVLAVGLLGAVMAFAAILPGLHANTWLFRDGRFYTNVAVTLTEQLSLEQSEFCASWYDGTLGWNRDLDPGWSNVALGRHDEHWPKHNWLLPLAASPLVFAFGLAGTLIFNLLGLGVVTAGLFRFARAFTSPAAAACASIAFVFGSAIVGQNAYDFSTDVFLLACFSSGLAALVPERGADEAGWRAGLLFGMAVVIRPTTVAFLLPLGVLAVALAGKKPLLRAVGGGAIVLGLAGIVNTYLFGAPWLTGYQRTLVVVGGHPEASSHTDLFSVPIEQGLVRMWEGEYGLRQAFTILALAIPGIVCLARRAKALTFASLVALVLSVEIFGRYAYEGHRFHWAALSFFVPALAASIDLVLVAVRRLVRARGVLGRRARTASFLAAVAAFAIWCAELPFGLPESRLGPGPIARFVRDALVDAGTIDRVATVICVLVHLVIGAALVAALVRIASRVVSAELAAAAVVVVASLPNVRGQVESGGGLLLVHALTVFSIERFVSGRHVLGAVFAMLGIALVAGTEEGGLLLHSAVSPLAALEHAVLHEGASRLALPIVVLGVLGTGAVLLGANERATSVAFALLALVGLIPGLATTDVGYRPIALLAMAPALAATLSTLAGMVGWFRVALPPRAPLAAGLAVLTLLMLAGTVRRVRADQEGFHLATYRGVRTAVVLLREGARDVPCDFLAWEHMSWECSHYDSGLYGMFGLALSGGPIEVGRVPIPLAVLPTGSHGQMRRVVWPSLRAGPELVLRWAIPDGQHGGGTLRVLIDDVERTAIELPRDADGWDRIVRIDTHEIAGHDARLELDLTGPDHHSSALVGIDAAW